MKRILYYLGMFLIIGIYPSNAQDCSEGFTLVNSLWEKVSIEQALTDPDAIIDDFNNLKGSLTSSLTKLSFKKDAPKLLPMNGKDRKGTVQTNSKRIYVTYLVGKETLQVTVHNNKQLPNAEVIICAHDKTGKTENLDSFVFSSEHPEAEKLFELTEVKGRIVSIAIKNTSEAKFEYQINALQI